MLQARRIAVAVFALVFCSQPASVTAQTTEKPIVTDPGLRKPASPEAAAAAAAPATPEGEVLTIFGRRKPGTYPGRGRIDDRSGSSCAFIGEGGVSDEVYDSYLDEADDRRRNRNSFLEKAPFGSAMNSSAELIQRQPGSGGGVGTIGGGGCRASDFAFAAGRASIARRDTSLRDAYMAFDNKDYPGALELFRKSYVKMGYPAAALMIGKMHLVGLGTPQNTPEAVKWLTKVTEAPFSPASAQRFDEKDPDFMSTPSDAAMLMGRIYMTGWGTDKDAARARQWHIKADKFGFVPGTYIVGRMFDSGYGGEKSLIKATKYYRKAGELGYAPAQYELGVILLEGDEGITAKPKEGVQWLLEAAKRGHPEALYQAGRMYDLGQVVAADPNTAIVYYKESALKGYAPAQTALGTYFYTGEIVGRDLVMARRWFFFAAENGDPEALLKLGAMFLNGEGGDKDAATAYALFRLAERAGLDAGGKAATALEAKLTPEDKAKAEAILNPPAA